MLPVSWVRSLSYGNWYNMVQTVKIRKAGYSVRMSFEVEMGLLMHIRTSSEYVDKDLEAVHGEMTQM